jgi:signal transduction histidine kinase
MDSALEEVVRLTRVTEDLLTLARSDAGVLKTQLQQIDLRVSARNVVERLTAGAAAKGVRLLVTENGDTTTWVDEHLVDRLIWNLVENGVKFTPNGGEVIIEASGDDGGVRIRVMDSGPGIPQASLARVFERFFQVDEARTRSSDAAGTGLGLAIVRAIADLHSATIDVRNRPTGGTEFTLYFPRILMPQSL